MATSGFNAAMPDKARGAVLGLAADGQVGLPVDEVDEPFAHERMVVHEENAFFAGNGGGGQMAGARSS